MYADGRSAELCQTPCNFNVDLADGGPTDSRTFVVRADGYEDMPVVVDFAARKREFSRHARAHRADGPDRADGHAETPTDTAAGAPTSQRTEEGRRPSKTQEDARRRPKTDREGRQDRQAADEADARSAVKPPRKKPDDTSPKPIDEEEADGTDRPGGHDRSVTAKNDSSPISRCLCRAALLAVAPRVAHADDPATRAARRHFERGEKLFALGKFDEALEEYQKAFDAKPLPGFLYNIGQCYRNLGDYDQAIFSFKKYLKLEPDAPNKDAVEQLIDELEDKKARGDGEKFVRKKPAEASEESKPIYKKWWFWTGVARRRRARRRRHLRGDATEWPADDGPR